MVTTVRFLRTTVLAIALLPTVALAWGQEGHSIIAEIAQHRLSSRASAEVARLLGPNRSLASISSWADDERDKRPETYRWHFVDIPLAESHYVPSRDCEPKPDGEANGGEHVHAVNIP